MLQPSRHRPRSQAKITVQARNPFIRENSKKNGLFLLFCFVSSDHGTVVVVIVADEEVDEEEDGTTAAAAVVIKCF